MADETLDTSTEAQPESAPVGDTTAPAESEQVPQASQGEPEQQQDTFYDPAQLPPELKQIYGRMQSSYQKRMGEAKNWRQAAELVERFNSDDQFAYQTLAQRAAAMGFQLVKPGQNGQQQQASVTPGQNGQIPNEYVQAIQNNLPPELHWLAPSLAQATFAMTKAQLEPLQRQQEQERQKQRDQMFDEAEMKMTERYPGWEQHEDEMTKLNDWLRSDSLSHPLYGSKLEILYKMATDQAASVSEAAKRLNAAARNRTSSSHVTSQSAPNIVKRVREAKTTNDAWDQAAKFAIEQVKGQGGTL